MKKKKDIGCDIMESNIIVNQVEECDHMINGFYSTKEGPNGELICKICLAVIDFNKPIIKSKIVNYNK